MGARWKPGEIRVYVTENGHDRKGNKRNLLLRYQKSNPITGKRKLITRSAGTRNLGKALKELKRWQAELQGHDVLLEFPTFSTCSCGNRFRRMPGLPDHCSHRCRHAEEDGRILPHARYKSRTQKLDWTIEQLNLLGKISDADLGSLLGVSPGRICTVRIKFGIPPFKCALQCALPSCGRWFVGIPLSTKKVFCCRSHAAKFHSKYSDSINQHNAVARQRRFQQRLRRAMSSTKDLLQKGVGENVSHAETN